MFNGKCVRILYAFWVVGKGFIDTNNLPNGANSSKLFEKFSLIFLHIKIIMLVLL